MNRTATQEAATGQTAAEGLNAGQPAPVGVRIHPGSES